MRNAHIFKSIIFTGIFLTLSSCAHFRPTQKDAQLQAIISQANEQFYFDSRIWSQQVQGEVRGQQLILTGEAWFPEPVKGIARRLKRAGYDLEVVDQVSYLPQHFKNDLAYGIITDAYVMSRYEPVDQKHEGTELLYGEPVRLVRETGDYFQVQSKTGYLGYLPKSSVRTMQREEWNRYHMGQQAVFERNINLEDGRRIMISTRLPYLGDETLLLPDGSTLHLTPENYRIVDPAQNPVREQIIAAAKQYMDLPYVWAGNSGDGLDCSGLVMQSYALNDIYLPRDSDEMASVGRFSGLPGWTTAMLPGDIVFFTGSKRLITHTGLYVGNGRVIHSSTNLGVVIQSLNPDDPDFNESLRRRFVCAKRVFE